MGTTIIGIIMICLGVVGYLRTKRCSAKAEDELLDEIATLEDRLAEMALERDRVCFELAAAEHQYNTVNDERIQLLHYAEELLVKLRRVATDAPRTSEDV